MANVANNGGKWIRQDKRLAIYLRDGMACVYCGCTHEHGADLTLDHVLAQELGGDNSETNLVTACRSCNSAKGSKSVRSFMAWLRDAGTDTSKLSAKIRKHTKRSITTLRKQAKAIISNR